MSSTKAEPTSQNSRPILQAESRGGWSSTPSTFYILEGFDLRESPQIERKRVLKSFFDETKLQSPILYSEHMLTTATRYSLPPAN